MLRGGIQGPVALYGLKPRRRAADGAGRQKTRLKPDVPGPGRGQGLAFGPDQAFAPEEHAAPVARKLFFQFSLKTPRRKIDCPWQRAGVAAGVPARLAAFGGPGQMVVCLCHAAHCSCLRIVAARIKTSKNAVSSCKGYRALH